MKAPKTPRLRLLGLIAELAIYLVDGEYIRDNLDIDFVNGGNEAVYPSYVPPGEIWIDDAQHAIDRTATALHELIERDLMLHHGMSYDAAHDAANGHERAFRNDLKRHRPARFDAPRLAKAYRIYRHETPRRQETKRLDQEIAQALSQRSSRSGSR